MLVQIRAWAAPTSDHDGLKKFMISQLEDSIEFDCTWQPEEPKQLSGAEYKAEQLAEAQRDIDYHTKEHAGEIERINRCNEWVCTLRKSLTAVTKIEEGGDDICNAGRK